MTHAWRISRHRARSSRGTARQCRAGGRLPGSAPRAAAGIRSRSSSPPCSKSTTNSRNILLVSYCLRTVRSRRWEPAAGGRQLPRRHRKGAGHGPHRPDHRRRCAHGAVTTCDLGIVAKSGDPHGARTPSCPASQGSGLAASLRRARGPGQLGDNRCHTSRLAGERPDALPGAGAEQPERGGPRVAPARCSNLPRASLVGVARGYDALLSWDTRPRDTPRIAAVSDTDSPAARSSAASAR